MFTNAASACFFSFSAFVFFSPTLIFAVTFAALAASFASFSNLFASFLAEDLSQISGIHWGNLRVAPAFFEFETGPSDGSGLGTACWEDIALTNPSDPRVGGKRYRCSSRIQFRSAESQVARLWSRSGSRSKWRTRQIPQSSHLLARPNPLTSLEECWGFI